MKSKFLVGLVAVLAITTTSLNARDSKLNHSLSITNDQFNDRYEQQRRAIQDAYNRDLRALAGQTNLTPMQRKQQRDQIRDRYLQQKKANQNAFKNDRIVLKDRREDEGVGHRNGHGNNGNNSNKGNNGNKNGHNKNKNHGRGKG